MEPAAAQDRASLVTESDITADDWREVVAGFVGFEDKPEALTRDQLEAILGMQTRALQALLKEMVEEGYVTEHRVRRTDAIGRSQIVPGYVLTPEAVERFGNGSPKGL